MDAAKRPRPKVLFGPFRAVASLVVARQPKALVIPPEGAGRDPDQRTIGEFLESKVKSVTSTVLSYSCSTMANKYASKRKK
jgi:hypothetical protein